MPEVVRVRITSALCAGSVLVALLPMAGCGERGEQAGRAWVIEQQRILSPTVPPPVPDVIDTPPASYTSTAYDPFSPERISARLRAISLSGQPGVLFPEAPLSALVIVGFMTGKDGEAVALVRNGPEYRSVRKGNRMSEQALDVRAIQGDAIILGRDGLPDQRLERPKLSSSEKR
jgi:Tfp pilus assembly protein PilP